MSLLSFALGCSPCSPGLQFSNLVQSTGPAIRRGASSWEFKLQTEQQVGSSASSPWHWAAGGAEGLVELPCEYPTALAAASHFPNNSSSRVQSVRLCLSVLDLLWFCRRQQWDDSYFEVTLLLPFELLVGNATCDYFQAFTDKRS